MNAEREISTEALINEALSFFSECLVDNVVEKYGDMLLFQFGVYDWRSGPFFEIGLTRQFVEPESGDEDGIMSQLHITRFYSPTHDLETVDAGEQWCRDRSELSDFSNWIMMQPALTAVTDISPVKTEIRWELV